MTSPFPWSAPLSPEGWGATSCEKCVKVGLVSEPTGVRVSFCIE